MISAAAAANGSFASSRRRKIPCQLIKFGWDALYVSDLSARVTALNALPFTGYGVQTKKQPMAPTAISQATYATELAAWPTLNATHNWILIFMEDSSTDPGYKWDDDALWSTVSANLGNLAAAIASSGKAIDGILLDTEYYGSSRDYSNFGSTTTPWSGSGGSEPAGYTAAQARDLARSRGKSCMNQVISQWPSAKFMTTYGPWLGESKSWTGGHLLGNNVAWDNELQAAFITGLQEACLGTQAKYVDGGECSYGCRTPAEFMSTVTWQKSGLAASGTFLYPTTTLINGVPGVTQAALGTYDYDVDTPSPHPLMSDSNLQSCLTNALQACDEYTWFYTEGSNWVSSAYSSNPAPAQSTINAVAAALQSAR